MDTKVYGYFASFSGAQHSYAPAHIVVSGSIGTAADPFGAVHLTATSSILIGSQAFLDEVQSGTTSQFFEPGLGGVAVGQNFITAGDVVLSGAGEILQQNTSPQGGGLDITGSLTIEGGPTEVDLFGVLPDGHGGELMGAAAARSSPDLFATPVIDPTKPPPAEPYRFNGCEFGGADCQPIAGVPTTYATPPLYAPVAAAYDQAAPQPSGVRPAARAPLRPPPTSHAGSLWVRSWSCRAPSTARRQNPRPPVATRRGKRRASPRRRASATKTAGRDRSREDASPPLRRRRDDRRRSFRRRRRLRAAARSAGTIFGGRRRGEAALPCASDLRRPAGQGHR